MIRLCCIIQVKIMKKSLNRHSMKIKISTTVMAVQLVVFVILIFFIDSSVTDFAGKNAVNTMETAALDRAELIKNHIDSAEDTLTSYLKAGEIYDLLSDPDNEEYIAAAQVYTDRFSADVDNLEGI